ncbi:MAG TPA: hypothetical protein VLA46_13150 [Saprospiraceae bacterium]|nr:hypothetical protein [Saprospiraceae bacterium]
MTLIVRQIYNMTPVIADLPEFTCIGDPLLVDLEATNDCGHFTLKFRDVNIPNPCVDDTAKRRTYEAYDACSNMSVEEVILLPEPRNEPLLVFIVLVVQPDCG